MISPAFAAVLVPAAAAALMILMALQLQLGATAAALPPGVPIGLPNCSTTCGDVVVPYPFGLGLGPSRCYWPGLNLTCDTTHHPPRLLVGDALRVTEISLRNQTMRVMGSRAVINTTGTAGSWNVPFGRGFTRYGYRLSYRNELVVDGCNAAATLLADFGVIAGCASLCTASRGDDVDDFFIGTKACTGTSGCCRAPLTTSAPKRLQARSLSSSKNNRTVEQQQPFIVYVCRFQIPAPVAGEDEQHT